MVRLHAAVLALVALSLSATACSTDGSADVQSTTRREASTQVAGVKVGHRAVSVVAAGDIARTPRGGLRTARLVQSLRPNAVLTLGDNAYEDGELDEYRRNYEPTWGQFKRITRPVPGNHEYRTSGAAGYFAYFAKQVSGQPYYAWTAGGWRLYALNCEIECGEGSAQLSWLRRDLAKHHGRPALAYLHQPRFTCSTKHPPSEAVGDLWAVLQRGGGRIILGAHNHAYERFAPQNAEGGRTPEGLHQFVVGTGGAARYPVDSPCRNREAAVDWASGVLWLRLATDHFRWRFVTVSGRILDEGHEKL